MACLAFEPKNCCIFKELQETFKKLFSFSVADRNYVMLYVR